MSDQSVSGTVHQAPEYIRVRPSWLEKFLLIALITQIILSVIFLVHGSNPARVLQDEFVVNRQMNCAILEKTNRESYISFRNMGYC